jgi:leucyl aminopeptidase
MEFRCTPASWTDWNGDTLAVGLFQAENDPARQGLIERFGDSLSDLLERRRFKAKPGEILTLSLLGTSPSTLLIVGLGEPDRFDLEGARLAAAGIAKALAGAGGELGIALPLEGIEPADAARALSEAVRLALYADDRFRSEAEPRTLPERVSLLGLPEAAGAGLAAVAATCAGVELARQLVASPPNVITPEALAQTAAELAAAFGLELKVLGPEECEALGMGAYLGVARGSTLPPRFIHLTYRPPGAVERRLVLVGKGLTFDSGGYNLKTAGSQIEMMKYDMGGSAAVLGTARAIGELKPPGVEVHVIVAACENMISGEAIHPGDVLTASNGKTIEINNTDAEGRLTLADALVYAAKLEPDAVVDLATLTGACVIALGEEIAGLWSSSDGLAQALLEAGRRSGEQLWRMPLQASYKEGLKSHIADLKNTGPRPGGSITAALFLQDFVPSELAWAHLDIAGTVWSDKGRGLDPAGATGFGVRTLVEWLSRGGPA